MSECWTKLGGGAPFVVFDDLFDVFDHPFVLLADVPGKHLGWQLHAARLPAQVQVVLQPDAPCILA